MIKRSQWLAAAAFMLAAGIAVALFRGLAADAANEAEQVGQVEVQVVQLRRELAALQARDLLHRQQAAPSAPMPSNVLASTTQVQAPPTDVAEPTPSKARAPEAVRDGLNVHFYGESDDRRWTQAERQKYQSKLGDVIPAGSKLVSFECRSSMCRAEVSHPDLDAHIAFIRSGFIAKPWQEAVHVSLGESSDAAKVTSVVFLAREGQALPYDSDAP
jgi:hypothetical protein